MLQMKMVEYNEEMGWKVTRYRNYI